MGHRGPTYDRGDVDVAVVTVPKTHAIRLQDDLLCALGAPPDNRIICAADDDERDADEPDLHPRGYDYDIDAIVDALGLDLDALADEPEDIPF